MTPENPLHEELQPNEPVQDDVSSREEGGLEVTTSSARGQELAGEAEESEVHKKGGGFLGGLRTAHERFREERKPASAQKSKTDGPATTSRTAKSEDRSKGLLVLAVTGIAVLFAVIGLLSHSSNKSAAARQEPNLGRPNLGRSESVTKPNRGSITPLQRADMSEGQANQDNGDQVSAEDVDRTRRPHPPEPVKPVNTLASVPPMADPALETYRRQVGASPLPVPAAVSVAPIPVASATQGRDVANPLNKSSLVFVSNTSTYHAVTGPAALSEALLDQKDNSPLLPNGSRLVARLQEATTTAVKTPAVAAIEYNYERDGEIVVPAGTKAFGELQQANKTGVVSLHFNRLEMADGTLEEINGTALSLTYGPLKGSVTGNNVAQRILVRSLAGIGATAAFLVGGPGGLSGASGGLDNSILLRERIATNAGLAGDQEVSNLAVNQQLVVTVPANTRFFIVLQQDDKGSRGRASRPTPSGTPSAPPNGLTQYASTGSSVLPTAEELRELIELKSEINRMYQQAAIGQPAAPAVDSSSADHATATATMFPETQP